MQRLAERVWKSGGLSCLQRHSNKKEVTGELPACRDTCAELDRKLSSRGG